MSYRIISDGSCDLPPELAEKQGISVVPFYVSFDDKVYKREIAEFGIRDFYQKMVDEPGVYPKSSMPTAPDFAKAFTAAAAAGEDIICICITTKFSGSMQSALLAKEMLAEKYPNIRITVIDAMVNTVLQGIYVLEAARLCRAGTDYDKAIERLLAMRASGRIFFTIGSMDYLQHGGRIGKLAGRVASMLSVRPLITLKEGEIFPSGIARNRQASRARVIDMLQRYLKETGRKAEEFTICIGYGFSREEAVIFRREIMTALNLVEEACLPLYQIGATIAVHTGPYPIGVGIMEKAF
ncbi:MAG: DegV family protein [Faecalibacterium sp.]|jgi:DegV family protein with EDD domain|nr:DegV family protein [Faecalibacterium sp.]